MGYTNASRWVMILFHTKMSFFDNFVKKNLTAAGVIRKYIWFSLPIPKIKLDPPPQGKKCFGVHILGPSLNGQFFPELQILSENLILLVLLGKIIIPLGNSVGDPIWVIQMHLGGYRFAFLLQNVIF